MIYNIYNVSNPEIVYENLIKYLKKNNLNINDYKLFLSKKKDKKYVLLDEKKGDFIHFGNIKYEDFTKHKDEERKNRYLKRAMNIRGKWRDNLFSPNNLSINLLW